MFTIRTAYPHLERFLLRRGMWGRRFPDEQGVQMEIKLLILTTLFGVIAGFYHFLGPAKPSEQDNA